MHQLPPISRLAVLSDIHLGRGDGRTGYHGRAHDVCRMLRAIAQQADQTVINGDLYDLDRGAIPMAQQREYAYLQPRWAEVETCIQELGIQITAGNHDWALRGKRVGGQIVHEALLAKVGPYTVHIEHGDRFDAWIKRNRRFTSSATWFSGWFSRHRMYGLYRLLRRIEALSTNDENGGQIERAHRWLAQQSHCDILVFGHTHTRCAQRCDDRWLLNPGDAMHPVANYVLIDADQHQITFFTLDPNLVSTPVLQLAL